MSALKITRWDAKKDGVLSVENVGRKLQASGYQYLQHVYEAGTVLKEHAHAEPRKDAVISGELKVSMSGTEAHLKPGDILDIPVGIEHTATVVGSEPVIVLEGALMEILIEHWKPERDGQLSAETMARKLASYGFTYMQQVYGPGSILSDHAHREPTRDAVVSGSLIVLMFGKEAKLGPGDMVEIPIGVQHGVRVLGTEPCVMFESAIVDLKVARWNAAADGGPPSLEKVASKLKSLGYHFAKQEYAVGTVFHEHSHEHHTKDAVVSGYLKVSMQGKEVVLGPGDILDIPAGIYHNAAVVGNEAVVVLEAEKGHIHRVHWNARIDGDLSTETMSHKLRSHGYDPTPVTLAPGTVHNEHSHPEPRTDAVLEGCLKVTLFGQEILLFPGDFLEIPCGVEHTAEVVSTEPAVVLEGVLGVVMVDAWKPEADGELNEQNFARKLKARGYHYKRHVYQPGTVFHDHAHEEHRKEGVLSGQLKFSMIGKEVVLKPGDLICVPIGIDHNTAVVGDEPAVVLDAVRGDLRVERWDAGANGVLTAENVTAVLQSRGYRCLVEEYKPGTTLHEHAHDEPRKDAVISGQLKVSLFGKEVLLKPGDIISIPEGIDHDATVVGSEPVVLVEAAK
jgi:quercetin dioxygenase-like cupin family protein